MLNEPTSYDRLREEFTWELPGELNIATLCADRHPPRDVALIDITDEGQRAEYTFGQLSDCSRRLANALRERMGIDEGDRVGIVLPQCLEVGLTHLAVFRLGAVALPLSGLFGPDALAYRLGDSEAKAVITDGAHLELVAEVAAQTDTKVICIDHAARPHERFWDLISRAETSIDTAAMAPDSPALLIYTSGTTGSAKGALHGQRVLHGHLPGFELSHNFFGQEDDRFWTPADWAWIGGLLDGLLPSWYHGRPVVASRRPKFDPEWALDLISTERVRNTFLPPTALKMIRQAHLHRPDCGLRTIACGGETLGDELLSWTADNLGVGINEFYGQTEANLLVGNCSAVFQVRPGSMGRPYPGHEVTILDDVGDQAASGEIGQIAVRSDDPVAFLRYWNKPVETEAKYTQDRRWLLTGDLASRDEDGYIWYSSRDDDVINSGGYRIGPAEIEGCLMHHPAVTMAAVVGVPDPVRGEAVKAFIQLGDPAARSPELESEIQAMVKTRLAAYLYPRQVEFVTELPMTTTGKVQRAELRRREAGSR
ncbi:MAG: AMP-binding protein [Solirubrobacterales bacterium]